MMHLPMLVHIILLFFVFDTIANVSMRRLLMIQEDTHGDLHQHDDDHTAPE